MRPIILTLLLTACSAPAKQAANVESPGGEAGETAVSEAGPPAVVPSGERIGDRTPAPPVSPYAPPPLQWTVPPTAAPGVLPLLVAAQAPYPTTGLPPGPAPNPGISEKWKSEVGLTTYKSTIHFFDGKIVVGSNGDGWKDTSDPLDGVHILDPKGKLIKQIVPPGGDEKDANGVALTKDHVFFGTDQEILYKTDWSGSVLWKAKLKGDVEAAPALADLNGDTVLDVAVGSEGGVFYTIDGKSGKTLEKVTAASGGYGATGFLGAAALFDVTGDGVADAFVPCRDDVFRAIDGKKGTILWSHNGGSGMHGAPIIVDADGDGAMEVVFTEAYSDVFCADAKTGSIKWKATLENPDGGIEGLFSPVGWFPDASCALVSTAWWGSHEGVYCLAGDTGQIRWRYGHPKRNISSGAVIGDIDGKPGAEAVIGTEGGQVVALDAQGVPVWSQTLGGSIECTPTLADIDGDGLTEVLAAASNGSLYAFDTPGKAPAVIGYHRVDPTNSGVMP